MENNVIAITPDHRKYHVQLSSAQLMDCLKINQVYICERHGVLAKSLVTSCLGALYLQDFEQAQKLCQIQIQPTRELVFQLLGNWFLIYSPIVFTADVHCKNGTLSRFFIPLGITKHFLSPGCYAEFKENILLSNNAIRLSSDIIHFEWQWEQEIFEHFSPKDLVENMQLIQQNGISSPTLSDISHLKVTKNSGFNYMFQIIAFVLSTLATSIVTIVILFLLGKYRHRIAETYAQMTKCCKPTVMEVTPANAENLPLNDMARNRNLPIYTDSYRRNHLDNDPL